MRIVPLLLSLALLVSGAHAGQSVYAVGLAGVSCGAWLQDRVNPANHASELEWVLGFVTGSNYRNTETQGRPPDTPGIEEFLNQYCENNPLQNLFLAAAALVQESGGPPALHKFKK